MSGTWYLLPEQAAGPGAPGPCPGSCQGPCPSPCAGLGPGLPPVHGHGALPGPGHMPGAFGSAALSPAGSSMDGFSDCSLSSRMRDGNPGAVVRRESDASTGEVTCRQARNNAEKARRDRVSNSINQMTAFVSILNQSPKKVDKITILRVVANHVRLHKLGGTMIESREEGGSGAVPTVLSEPMEALVLEDSKSVAFMISSVNGKIVYVTKTVENVLGHSQVELLGQEFKRLVHEDDQDIIKEALQPLSADGSPLKALELVSSDDSSSDDTGTSTSMSSQDSPSCSSSPLPSAGPPPPPPPPETQKRKFQFRIQQRPVSRSDSPQFEEAHAEGFLWVPGRVVAQGAALSGGVPGHDHRRRSSDDPEANSCLLVVIVKLARENRGLQALSVGMNRNEYYTRHLPNGNFLTTDFRISLVSGYLPEEVVGVDAFTYMHQEDAKWAQVALQYMLMHGEETGYSCYRLRSKTGEYIHLKTAGYLEKDEVGNIKSFICINSMVTEEEASIAKARMQKRFAPHFSNLQPRESGVRIVELSDDIALQDRETVRAILPSQDDLSVSAFVHSPTSARPGRPGSLPAPSPELQTRLPGASSSTATSAAGAPTFPESVAGRASVLHMAGDVRRSQGRKRSSDADLRPQKRTCPTSPVASATVTAAAALSPLGPSASLVGVAPSPSHLSVDVAPHAPHALPLRGCTVPAAALPGGPGGPGRPGRPPGMAAALSPGLPSGLDLNLPVVLDGVLLDPSCASYPNLDVFPNEWGRRVAPAPAPDQIEPALPAPLAASGPDGGLLALSHMDMQMAGDVTQGSIFLVGDGMNGIPRPNPQDIILQQGHIETNLQVQGQQMLSIQTDLNQVPPNNPERQKLENELFLAKEAHIRQGKELHEIQQETRRANQQTYC